jgi:hypothetical protein
MKTLLEQFDPINFNCNNLCRQIQLSGLRSTGKFLIQLMTTDQLLGLQRLALVYFYFCSTDPRVAIFNDKLQPDVDGSVIWNCILNLIGSPIGQEEAMLCQETSNNLDQSHARIAACASCCERPLSVDGQQGIIEMKINDLPSEFLITESQKECLTALPQYTVQNHIQAVNHNGTFYHLNPDLVFGVNQIVLCRVCAENPMTKDQESIAAGNDYG